MVEPRGLERQPRRLARGVDAIVHARVHAEHVGPVAGEVAARRETGRRTEPPPTAAARARPAAARSCRRRSRTRSRPAARGRRDCRARSPPPSCRRRSGPGSHPRSARAPPRPRPRPGTHPFRPPPRAGRAPAPTSPLAAKRPATLRMWSVSPRFSWMTSTPPRTRAAGAQAAISVPRGPANVIGWVATGAHIVWRPSPPCPCPCPPSPPFSRAVASAAIIAVAAVAPTPSSPSLRIASRRVMIPSTWSSATSSARYRCNSVIRPPPIETSTALRRVPDRGSMSRPRRAG